MTLSSEMNVNLTMLTCFGTFWREEYLRNMPPMSLKKPYSDLKTGSVLLVRNETKSRLLWPIGIVIKLFPGKDGHVRVAELKNNKGLTCRAVQKLHRLEFLEKKLMLIRSWLAP